MSLLLITSVYDQTHYGWKCHWNFRKGMLYFSFVKFITFNKWLLLCTRIKIGNVILHIVMRVDIFHHMSSQLPPPPTLQHWSPYRLFSPEIGVCFGADTRQSKSALTASRCSASTIELYSLICSCKSFRSLESAWIVCRISPYLVERSLSTNERHIDT